MDPVAPAAGCAAVVKQEGEYGQEPPTGAQQQCADTCVDGDSQRGGDGINVPRHWLSSDGQQFVNSEGGNVLTWEGASKLLRFEISTFASQTGTETGPAASPVTAKEAQIARALSEGSFSLQGVVGKHWKVAKEDPKLRSQCDALGKSYSKQRAFRMQWLQDEYDSIIASRVRTEEECQVHENQGTYEPFDIIVDKEGGPQRPQAIAAALSYTLSCVKFHEAGQRAGDKNGAPWVMLNEMTSRWEFLYLKKGFKDWFSSSWKLTKEHRCTIPTARSSNEPAPHAAVQDKPEPAGQSEEPGALGGEPGTPAKNAKPPKKNCPQPNNPEPKDPQPNDPKPKAKAAGTPNGKRSKPTEGGDNADPAKKVKKEQDEFFRILRKMRSDMGVALGIAGDVRRAVATDPTWSWAQGPVSEPLVKAQRFCP